MIFFSLTWILHCIFLILIEENFENYISAQYNGMSDLDSQPTKTAIWSLYNMLYYFFFFLYGKFPFIATNNDKLQTMTYEGECLAVIFYLKEEVIFQSSLECSMEVQGLTHILRLYWNFSGSRTLRDFTLIQEYKTKYFTACITF